MEVSIIASRVEKNKLAPEEAQEVKRNISFTQELKEAVNSADFVIE
jgi:3-hydroxyacyl-CoA dehydrogenase